MTQGPGSQQLLQVANGDHHESFSPKLVVRQKMYEPGCVDHDTSSAAPADPVLVLQHQALIGLDMFIDYGPSIVNLVKHQ